MEYNVNEIFTSLQGEASFAGTPSIFIRLQGCNVGCPWCDTKHTWTTSRTNETDAEIVLNKTSDGESWAKISGTRLSTYLQTNFMKLKHVVITGGEPAIYDLTELCGELESLGKQIQIETSGTETLKISPNAWITLSPKIGMPGNKKLIPESVARANEIKIPIGKPSDIILFKEFLHNFNIPSGVSIWLQPLSQNQSATKLCINECLANGWRLSLQLHKYINVR